MRSGYLSLYCSDRIVHVSMANCLYLLSLLAVQLFSLAVTQSVAPNDAHRYCLNRPGRIHSFSNEKVVLDTQNYNSTTLLSPAGLNRTWLSIDIDSGPFGFSSGRWTDSNQLLNCEHNLTACSGMSNQANWMMTQYINISQSGVQQTLITVNVTFASNFFCQSCGQQTYDVYTYQTDEIDEAGRGNISMYSFEVRLIHTANTGITYASESFNVTTSGFYLAILDSGVGGGCVVVNRIAVYYNICPYQIQNMVVYPETIAPSDEINGIPVTATCIDNSSQSSNLQLSCQLSGRWSGDVSCTCNAGYEPVNMSCEACIEGSYKSVQGNEFCEECPANSVSIALAATGCTCLTGYYRANNESIDTNCTAPPSSPQYLANTSVSPFTINITWTAPSDTGGRTDLFYTINIAGAEYNTVDTQYTLTELTPLTAYTILVIARNGVSDQDSINDDERTINITVTTLSSLPSGPEGVFLNNSLLIWTAPNSLYGILMEYRILISTNNNISTAQVRARLLTPFNNSYDLNVLDIPNGVYYIWVQAVDDNGPGDFSSVIQYVISNPVTSINITTASNSVTVVSTSATVTFTSVTVTSTSVTVFNSVVSASITIKSSSIAATSTSVTVSNSVTATNVATATNTAIIISLSVVSQLCFLLAVFSLLGFCVLLTKMMKKREQQSTKNSQLTHSTLNPTYETHRSPDDVQKE